MTSAVGYWPVPPEVRKEFGQWLDGYIEQYRKAIDRLLKAARRPDSRHERTMPARHIRAKSCRRC
jgi:hypothetical protein